MLASFCRARPSSRASSLVEILLWIDVSSQINSQTKYPFCFYAVYAAPPMPAMCKYVRIRGQHVRGRGRQSSVPVRHVFARIFARIPRIWGHVFCDSNPRISRVLTPINHPASRQAVANCTKFLFDFGLCLIHADCGKRGAGGFRAFPFKRFLAVIVLLYNAQSDTTSQILQLGRSPVCQVLVASRWSRSTARTLP